MQGHENKSESEDTGELGILCVVDLKMMLCMFTVVYCREYPDRAA